VFSRLRRVGLASAVVVPALIGLSVTSASAAPASHDAIASTQTGPFVKITGSGHSSTYSRKQINGLTAANPRSCGNKYNTFSIINKTSQTQHITLDGKSAALAAGDTEYFCADNTGSYVFGLKSNPSSSLTVHVTAAP
jgi:hypothetical protein